MVIKEEVGRVVVMVEMMVEVLVEEVLVEEMGSWYSRW